MSAHKLAAHVVSLCGDNGGEMRTDSFALFSLTSDGLLGSPSLNAVMIAVSDGGDGERQKRANEVSGLK